MSGMAGDGIKSPRWEKPRPHPRPVRSDLAQVPADARQGAPGERLFTRAGYTALGAIPRFQRGPGGEFDSTVIFYRHLGGDTAARRA